jgi:hypothetical protein
MNEYSFPQVIYSSFRVNHESVVDEFNAAAKRPVYGEDGRGAVKGACDPDRIVVLNQCLGEPGFVGTIRASAPAGDKWLRGPDKDGDGG